MGISRAGTATVDNLHSTPGVCVFEHVLGDQIDALLRYLETHGEVDDDRLPEWDEFQELAADYEVRPS